MVEYSQSEIPGSSPGLPLGGGAGGRHADCGHGTRQKSGGEPRSPRAGGGWAVGRPPFLVFFETRRRAGGLSYVALLTRYYNLSLYFIIKICKLRFNGDILVKTGIIEKNSLSFLKSERISKSPPLRLPNKMARLRVSLSSPQPKLTLIGQRLTQRRLQVFPLFN